MLPGAVGDSRTRLRNFCELFDSWSTICQGVKLNGSLVRDAAINENFFALEFSDKALPQIKSNSFERTTEELDE